MMGQIDNELSELLGEYLRNWGPISWRSDLETVNMTPNPSLGRALLALSGIESDSRVIYRKLHIANLDRRNAIQEFNISWLAEEAEHGRALRVLACKLGETGRPPQRSARKSVRSTLAWPSLAASRVIGTPLEATYLTLGALQEYAALTTYRKIAEMMPDPTVSNILRRIAAQEGRHMHFYRGAALLFLQDRRCSYVASRILGRLWRPPGLDLLGAEAWLAAFAPLLKDADYCARLVRMDEVLRRLPGFESATFMERFLLRNGYPETKGERLRATGQGTTMTGPTGPCASQHRVQSGSVGSADRRSQPFAAR